jgi:glyoxylase-like metal-dependent hydrolase (beta-lactamase superfamily II)
MNGPRRPIDLGDRVRELPMDGSVPTLGGWRSVHTPGHTAGHVALFRELDRTLIAGDAFCTTKPESFFTEVVTQFYRNCPISFCNASLPGQSWACGRL